MRESWPQIWGDSAPDLSVKSYRRSMCDCILAQDPFNICAIYSHIMGDYCTACRTRIFIIEKTIFLIIKMHQKYMNIFRNMFSNYLTLINCTHIIINSLKSQYYDSSYEKYEPPNVTFQPNDSCMCILIEQY